MPDYNPSNVLSLTYDRERHLLNLLEQIGKDPDIPTDPRWLAIAKTDVERAFMALRRAIMPRTL